MMGIGVDADLAAAATHIISERLTDDLRIVSGDVSKSMLLERVDGLPVVDDARFKGVDSA